MLYAIKGNREYKITEDERQKYINAGYKIGEIKNGVLVFQKEVDKTKELEKEKTALKEQLAKANNKISALEKEKSALKEQLTKANNKISKIEKAKGEGK
jgi:predicted nuclease with TOPRIM domain